MSAAASTDINRSDGGFNSRLILWLVGAAIISFLGYVFLAAHAPEMKMGEDGRGHALSESAIGFRGMVKLREALGRTPQLVRDVKALATDRLVVVTPEYGTDPAALAKIITKRGENPTLIILPKHSIYPDPLHPGWVNEMQYGNSLIPTQDVAMLLSKIVPVSVKQNKLTRLSRFTSSWSPPVTFDKNTIVQTISGDSLISYINDENGDILLSGVRGKNKHDYTPVYILSDPDVMNNLSIANPHLAWAATRILDQLATDKKTRQVDFDVTLNGFEGGHGLLKLVFEPPFLALSLCLLVAAVMALLHGLLRFGPPLREARAVAPGKAALVNNTAGLLRLAGIEHEVGGRYAALTRDMAAQSLGLAQGTSTDAVVDRLDVISRNGPTFTTLAATAEHSADSETMLAVAQALFKWRKEKTG